MVAGRATQTPSVGRGYCIAVPADALDSKVAEIAGKTLGNPRHAVGWSKVVLYLPLKQLAIQSMDASIANETLSNMTADLAEAVAAFRQRRPPRLPGCADDGAAVHLRACRPSAAWPAS